MIANTPAPFSRDSPAHSSTASSVHRTVGNSRTALYHKGHYGADLLYPAEHRLMFLTKSASR
ncbi:hypothetical protein BDW66DRAFT_144052 [Aspergillus desertorum]